MVVVWIHYPAPFWAIWSQVYIWIWVLWYVPVSKINLQKQRRKLPFLFVFFIFLLIWMENFHFILRHGECLQLLVQPSIWTFKILWRACLKNPFSSGGKMTKLGNICIFISFFLLIILAWFIKPDLQLPVVTCCSLKLL